MVHVSSNRFILNLLRNAIVIVVIVVMVVVIVRFFVATISLQLRYSFNLSEVDWIKVVVVVVVEAVVG